MNGKVFVDTNILVYNRDRQEIEKQKAAAAVLEELWRNGTGRISTQVCSEYFVTVTGKLTNSLDEITAWEDIEDLQAWNPVPIDMKCLRIGRHIQAVCHISWWDSLIVAAASIAGCGTLLSEDFNPSQQYLGITVVNPFLQL